MKGKRIWSGLLALVFCLGLLPATALAAGGSGEHTGHNEWTALTADVLKGKNYQLEGGQYYFSGEENEYDELVIETPSVLTVTGNVTLCLNDVHYTYTGNEESAVVVEENASLTICCCQDSEGTLSSSKADKPVYTVYNKGTLRIVGGNIYSNTPKGAPVYNAGTCTVSGGTLQGSASISMNEQRAAYGIYNANGANLTITGDPSISGSEPGRYDSSHDFTSAGPQM